MPVILTVFFYHNAGVTMQRRMPGSGWEKLFESCKITACPEICTDTDADRMQAPRNSNMFFEV